MIAYDNLRAIVQKVFRQFIVSKMLITPNASEGDCISR